MEHAFGDVHEYDTMICSLYEIRQKEGEFVEEYMLQIHEAICGDLLCLPGLSHGPREEFGAGSVLSWPSAQFARCPAVCDGGAA